MAPRKRHALNQIDQNTHSSHDLTDFTCGRIAGAYSAGRTKPETAKEFGVPLSTVKTIVDNNPLCDELRKGHG